MHRLNRSAHAQVGTTFFLFLSLAILPVSLRAAGVQVSFSPRLSAAIDALQQIAEVFGASYHPAPTSELSVLKPIDTSNPIEVSASARSSEFACTEKNGEWAGAVLEVPNVSAHRAAPVLRASLRSEARRSPTAPLANRTELFVEAGAIKATFEKPAPAIAALGAIKLETLTRQRFVKEMERPRFRQSAEPVGEIRSLPAPKIARVLVQIMRGAAGSWTKRAECKVFSALASARRLECDRAILTGTPPASLDNSEF